MLLDVQNLFSDAQAVTVTANSTNVIDLLVARDLAPARTSCSSGASSTRRSRPRARAR
jgi:hypothetical protein